ncbi:MAG: hypothetical protein JWN56_75 [Sphingobacteriales bacterium]|nr:hypothetical protein [Sphingobacteriales bacterium]
MKRTILLRDYNKFNDAVLDAKAQSIISALTGNANFPVTAPTLAIFTGIKNTYSASFAKASNRDRTAVAQKKVAKAALLANLNLLAINLESIALGDRVKLVSSGMEINNESESVPALSAPTDMQLTDGINIGEMRFTVKAAPQAVAYVFEYTVDAVLTEDSKWISKTASTREYLFTGLTSGVRIFCRVGAIGRKGQEAFTSIISRIVQ